MVNPDVVARKVASASARLADADEILSQGLEAFLADIKSRDLATFYIFLAIQDSIDLASHWVSDAGWSPPGEAAEAFDCLADHDVIDRKLATAMRAATGLRNRIAHGYASVDHTRLHQEYRDGSGAIKRFLSLAAGAAGL